MQRNFNQLLAFIILFGLSFQSFATSFETIKYPLQEKELVLAFHRERLSDQNGTYSLLVRCQLRDNSGQNMTLNTCPSLEFLRVFKADKELLPREEVLGQLKFNQFPGLLTDLIAKYDSSYNPSPLVLGAATGFIVGVAVGELSLAITLGLVGAVIDIAKAPVTLPYTAVSKIHRLAQRKNMKKRFENLLQNSKFKSTRIFGNMQFHNMTNNVLDYCATHGNKTL